MSSENVHDLIDQEIKKVRTWVVDRVSHETNGGNPAKLWNIQIDCLGQIDSNERIHTINHFLEAAHHLTGFDNGTKLFDDPAFSNRTDLQFRADEFLIDRLTATWLGLYFLGVPFIHPWEHVRWLVERSGFPSVSSLCKAIGDVFRKARQVNMPKLDCLPEPGPTRPNGTREQPLSDDERSQYQVIVLTRQPFALFRHLLEDRSYDNEMTEPDDGHVLARCYLLLQMRLYVSEGLPITYLIPKDCISPIVAAHNGAAKALTANEIHDWLNKIVFGRYSNVNSDFASANQTVRLLDDSDLSGLGERACVLNAESGIYTLDRMDVSQPNRNRLPFLGGIISTKDVVDAYREKLAELSKKGSELLDLTPDELGTTLGIGPQASSPPFPPAPGTPHQ